MKPRFILEVALAACLLPWACRNGPPAPTIAVPASEPALASDPAPPLPSEPDACLDEVLRRAGLNRFGDPSDTMYAGGSPLFNERTGETRSRRAYVSERHPDLVAQCPEEAK